MDLTGNIEKDDSNVDEVLHIIVYNKYPGVFTGCETVIEYSSKKPRLCGVVFE